RGSCQCAGSFWDGSGNVELFAPVSMEGVNVSHGQYCDICKAESSKAHPSTNAIDGTERWWQSPPLSRGLEYNEVNVTLDLGQLFHVAYVLIKFANSPRPDLWVLERSTDFGRTYSPWQYFASSKRDCIEKFGPETVERIIKDNDAICTTEYSRIVPLENGEVVVSLVNGRPGAMNFSYSPVLRDFTKATSIRLRFLRTNTLLGHLMGKALRDPTVTRRYYYSIKDISIGGRCVCNGHADMCTAKDPTDPYRLHCDCQHNTCGGSCDQCCPGYNQLQWKPATTDSANECEACNCNGHAFNCMYDPEVDKHKGSLNTVGRFVGGGVCINCQHNTTGVNCGHCATGYYRTPGVPIESVDACIPCNCNSEFMEDICDDGTGRCYCKYNYAGETCESCALGYYDFPNCYCKMTTTNDIDLLGNNILGYTCRCSGPGIADGACNEETGQCFCRQGFEGFYCELCVPGYFNYPLCQLCSCSMTGSLPEVCDPSGQCLCKAEFDGARCDQCQVGFHSYPHCHGAYTSQQNRSRTLQPMSSPLILASCVACSCDPRGSVDNVCGSTGQCQCQHSYSGLTCNQCGPGYFGHPSCTPCRCNVEGSYINTCDPETGRCSCRPFVTGLHCDTCVPGAYGFPNCRVGSCNPAGILCLFSIQDSCQCRMNVEGSVCDTCKPLYWNLTPENPQGCSICQCYTDGTLNSVAECMQSDGQCFCKPNVCRQSCMTCKPGYYSLSNRNYFGCKGCQCDIGGSVGGLTCDDRSGRCQCRQNVEGRTCSQAKPDHYFPDLHHLRSEIEDGTTPEGRPVRFGFSLLEFEDFSWRGYALMSHIQVIVTVNVSTPDLFRIVFRYVNRGPTDVKGMVMVSEINLDVCGNCSEQTKQIIFAPSVKPSFVTVPQNTFVEPFVLNPGIWSIVIEAQDILLDYLVLLPSAYYEAPILQLKVTEPCMYTRSADDTAVNCLLYRYLSLHNFPSLHPAEGSCAYENYLHSQCQVIQPTPRHPPMVILNHQQVNHYVITTITFSYVATTSFRMTANLCGLLQSKVYLIPHEDFNMEYVQPNVHCISTHGAFTSDGSSCAPSRFQKPSQSIMLTEGQTSSASTLLHLHPLGNHSIDQLHRPQQPSLRPATIMDTADVILLGSPRTVVTFSDRVQTLGRYAFVIHFYQPEHPTFPAEVLINGGRLWQGYTNASFCPHAYGCRSTVLAENKIVLDVTDNDVSVIIRVPDGKTLWLGYMLIVPETSYNPNYLVEEPLDKSYDFISGCGANSFYVNPATTSTFCKHSAISLSAFYNNGALPCACHEVGASRTSCDPFGGQCICRPNVIGRDCTRCVTGYYGFPNCRPCNCGKRLCEEVTGQCICPPRTIKPECIVCQPQTFGCHPLVGCEECNCSRVGVQNLTNGCNIESGQCRCKPNVAGRQCSRCAPGYYHYPNCMLCDCDEAGTEASVCDSLTGQCHCKENVEGPHCNTCRLGTFYLDPANPKGCTSCFCFGATNRCHSSTKRRSQLVHMHEWSLVSADHHELPVSFNPMEMEVEADLRDIPDVYQELYWRAPPTFLGDQVSSYGGYLTFQLRSEVLRGDILSVPVEARSDVILKGNQMTIMYVTKDYPSPGQLHEDRVQLVESNFRHMQTHNPVSREELMMVLASLDALRVRALHSPVARLVGLRNVELERASLNGSGIPASNVEICLCPANYMGDSCQDCARGYYRDTKGLFLGKCVPCNCNGHSDQCLDGSGICINCQHNTEGDRCERCKTGLVEHVPEGEPSLCVQCPCPLTVASNNFAKDCIDRGDHMQCLCKPGYAGVKCERCAPGYFGNPLVLGSRCQPCTCHGNTDSNMLFSSCDWLTGTCQGCVHHTAGHNCEFCAPGFFGDAVAAKNCTPCDCLLCGTESCDRRTGECRCKPGITGHRCDRCEQDGRFGYDTCAGCQRCACDLAALEETCHTVTGQCQCAPGIGGRQCQQCAPGYWRYTPHGCRECECNGGPCNPRTGACTCTNGLGGRQCDTCLQRYQMPIVDAANYIKCEPCDSCVLALLETLNRTEQMLPTLSAQLAEMNISSIAWTRMRSLSNSIRAVTVSNTDRLWVTPGHRKHPATVNIRQLMNKTQSDISAPSTEEFLEKFAEVQKLLEEMRMRDFRSQRNVAEKEEDEANKLLERVKEKMEQPLQEIKDNADSIRDQIAKHNSKLMDLRDALNEAVNKTSQANEKNKINQLLLAENKVGVYGHGICCIVTHQEQERLAAMLDGARMALIEKVKHFSPASTKIPIVERAEEHARSLDQLAANLSRVIEDTNQDGFILRAVSASNAYSSIIEAVKKAENAARDANNAAVKALKVRWGIWDIATLSCGISVLGSNETNFFSLGPLCVAALNETIPLLLDKLNKLEVRNQTSNISESINRIRELISQARSAANKVQVPMKFIGTSGVQLRSPVNPDDLKAYTSLSFSIQREKQARKRSFSYSLSLQTAGDYMGVAMRSGKLVWVYKLGSAGEAVLQTDTEISDDRFDTVKLERIQQYGRISYTVEKGTITETRGDGKSKGNDTLLNLDPEDVVFYAGGYPPDFTPPAMLRYPNFEGCIELGTLNEEVISLYNLIQTFNLNTTADEPCRRYKSTQGAESDSSYFDGSGFAEIKMSSTFSTISRFEQEVCLASYNGILLFMREKVSVSITIQIIMVYSGAKMKIYVRVDRMTVLATEQQNVARPSFSLYYLGGAPVDKLPESLRSKFPTGGSVKGCMRSLKAMEKNLDLKREKTIGVSYGCSLSLLVTDFKGQGYLSLTPENVPALDNNFVSGFGFQTQQRNALMFYYPTEKGHCQVSLKQGLVALKMFNTEVKSKIEYTDGSLHYISFGIHNQQKSHSQYFFVPQEFLIIFFPKHSSSRSSFSMEVRCNSSHGMLFYVSNELETSYMTLMLSKGRFVFMFNVKGNKLRIPSKEKYNDGQWHTVSTTTNYNYTVSFASQGHPQVLDTITNTEHISHQSFLFPSASSFDGCIRNFQLDGKHMVVPSRMYNVIPCFEGSLEMGTFFAAGGGYVILGIIIIIIILENEHLDEVTQSVILQINNGAGAFSAAVTPQHSLCDGQWHRIAGEAMVGGLCALCVWAVRVELLLWKFMR
uniref:Laminin, alpha 5 n=1 Tax=Callorhinchus milii TaxID=7868 RepID=A0A4W3J866_CALMI